MVILYHLEVMLEGTPLNDPGNPTDGMVMDSDDLNSIVTKHIWKYSTTALGYLMAMQLIQIIKHFRKILRR
ncbi:MAG: hypothetical protein IPN46_07985 [Saprospiraceae bacterium]|nr:hypothetical protein [Saprospiraceae bacterium]